MKRGWTDNKRKFVAALAEGRSVAEAVKACRIKERTARQWLQEPEILAEAEAVYRLMLFDMASALSGASAEAVRTLRDIVTKEAVQKDAGSKAAGPKDADRIRAASALLGLGLRLGLGYARLKTEQGGDTQAFEGLLALFAQGRAKLAEEAKALGPARVEETR